MDNTEKAAAMLGCGWFLLTMSLWAVAGFVAFHFISRLW